MRGPKLAHILVEYLGNPSLGLYWLKGRVIAIIHVPRPQNFVSAFVNINVCPPPFFGKMFTKSTDKNRVGPPPAPPPPINMTGSFGLCFSYLKDRVCYRRRCLKYFPASPHYASCNAFECGLWIVISKILC